jgi:DNA-binding transcriptional MerR regulator
MIRIGELARRAGVPSTTLRAWERRYGVVTPQRAESGYRLYSPGDERRLRSMVALIESGMAPAEAADRVREKDLSRAKSRNHSELESGSAVVEMREELIEALLEFENTGSERVLDRAISALSTDAFVGDLVLPALKEIGERWSRGDVTVGQEHFASNMLRGRLLGLARGWDGGDGNLALLACPPGEYHDIGLIGFGLALRARGWRITFLGADTPIESIVSCAQEMEAAVVVVYSMAAPLAASVEAELGRIAALAPLLLAGSGVDPELADRLGATQLAADPLLAADSLVV